MRVITVTTIVQTRFDIPDTVSIERIRQLGLPVLSEHEEETDALSQIHDKALAETFMGDATATYQSVEHMIQEGDTRLAPVQIPDELVN